MPELSDTEHALDMCRCINLLKEGLFYALNNNMVPLLESVPGAQIEFNQVVYVRKCLYLIVDPLYISYGEPSK